MLIVIIAIILIIIILYLILIKNKINIETMDRNIGNQGSKPYSTTKKFYTGIFNSTFNGRAAIDDQYFDDKLLKDVVYYPNEYDKNNHLISTGWINCKKDCLGNCLSYGLTDNSYCFSF